MALLTILEFPDKRLRKTAQPITKFTDKLQSLIDNMLETMYDAPGIGLAATQINVHQQLLVIDISENKDQPLIFINPAITIIDEAPESYEEGCLSVPGYYETVTRPAKVKINALNRQNEAFSMAVDGLLAVCIQHEVDHLNGKLFVDYISPLKRNRIRSQLEKVHRQQKD